MLELGCGLYSTPLFLDSNYWLALQDITSIETDGQWLQRVVSMLGHDSRWKPQLVKTTVGEWLRPGGGSIDTAKFDLIFVDDSAGVVQRSETLRSLLSLNPRCPIVVHDVEQWRLRSRIWSRRPYVIFDAFTPQTVVCNCGSKGQRLLLKRANAVLQTFRNEVLTSANLEQWESIGRAAIQGLDTISDGFQHSLSEDRRTRGR